MERIGLSRAEAVESEGRIQLELRAARAARDPS